MILRRVIAHFRKQEWTAIFLDFVIVVVGVFVGLQVSNWNAARQAQVRADIYGARLAADLRHEAWAYEYQIAYYKEVRTNALRAAAAMTDGPALSDEQLVISAYRASQYIYNGSRRATFDEMVATGDIGIIADRRLRETALTYYADPTVATNSEEARNSEYRKMFRRIVSVDVQRALLAKCGDRIAAEGDYAGLVGSIDYACALDLPAGKIAAAAAALRADPLVLPALQLRFADLETAIFNLEQGTSGLLENLRAIAGENKP